MGKTRKIFSTLLGAMAAIALIALGEWIMEHFYSMPPGIDMNDKKALAAAIDAMPLGAFLGLLVSYAVASFAGGLIASFMSGREVPRSSIIVGAILTLAGLWNIILIPHPLWFSIANLLVYVPFAYLGFKLSAKKQPAD